ncbi:Iron(3+)-hydroxamate import system permease protein FhuB [Paraliobacillus sp. PM-2]|uniref:iron ABC transporter permease n=1 Tax=Paraliobacillus sp. PM-2 TaxID=1462524 RepID=UPI00061CD5FB|nr:iron ABC transporter permease [Paraliobacillus sp. PM-2]CQR46500.1 Iron(3+)-hydroxamate import system permease protein FhuB [Paraliobacillus sp. PM-2]
MKNTAITNGLKTALTFGGGAVLLVLFLFIHINQGSVELAPSVIVDAIFQPQDILQHHTVRYLRLPRAVIGMLAGGALAVSGVILQTIAKNPLASASTLGIHSGSYFAVVLSTVFIPSTVTYNGLIIAFLGGILTAGIAYVLAGTASGNQVKLVLAGMVITMMFSAFTSLLQLFYENETAGLFLWGSGTLVQNNWDGVQFAFPFILIGLLFALLLAKSLDIFRLGEDVAKSLGQRVTGIRLAALIISVFLTAVTVSVVGPIGFVGLIAPHLIKLLGYQNHFLLIIGSFIWGANVLLGADILARIIDPSFSELPVGAITAFIGAPWLIWLVLQKRKDTIGNDKTSAMLVGKMKIPFSPMFILLFLVTCLIILITIGMSTGNNGIQLMESFRALTGVENTFIKNIIINLRLPRLLVAAVSGALLAISGFIFQGVLRNPLADPSVIGITSGAGVGALLVLYVSGISAVFVPLGAFGGALLAFLIVMLLSYRAKFQPTLLALLGIGVSAFGSAIIQMLVVNADMGVASALTWLAGSTYAKSWSELFTYLVGPFLLVIPILLIQMRQMATLALGDDTAKGLGMRVTQTRFLLALWASLLAAASVAAVGSIGFVGLIAPHLARIVLGPNQKYLLPIVALLGAVVLMFADILSRTLFVPKEIPSGILVALIGAPYFLFLMYRSNRIRGA